MTAEEYYKEAEAARRSGKMNDAAALYRKAAEKDHGNAQLKLGQCCLNGRGVNKNKRVAVIWLKKAAEKGLPDAEFLLALCYEKGDGVAADRQQAIYWYGLAHRHGDPDAAAALASLGAPVSGSAAKQNAAASSVSPNVPVNGSVAKQKNFPKYSEQYILDLLTVPVTFRKGKNYYLEKRVHNLRWNKDGSIFQSTVSGTYDYNCTLHFNGNKLIGHDCNCPAHYNYSGPCKHIVATMLAISAEREKAEAAGRKIYENNKNAVGQKSAVKPNAVKASTRSGTPSPGRQQQAQQAANERMRLQRERDEQAARELLRRQREREAEETRLQKIKEEQQRIEAQKQTESREEDGGVSEWFKEYWWAVLIVGCIIFGVISLIAGWVEGAGGAFIALIFVILFIKLAGS